MKHWISNCFFSFLGFGFHDLVKTKLIQTCLLILECYLWTRASLIFHSRIFPHALKLWMMPPSRKECIAWKKERFENEALTMSFWKKNPELFVFFFDRRFSDMDVSENSGTPKSSILTGFSIINHPFWGTPIFGNTHIPTHELHKWFFGCDMLIRRQLPPFIAGVCSRCGNSIRRMFFLFPDGYDFEHARRKHVFFLTFNGDFSEYQTGLLHIFFDGLS